MDAWLRLARQRIDSHIDRLFESCWPASFRDPLRYPLFTGGKRFRPALVLAAHEAVGGGNEQMALHAGAAVELVHTYSLVHDDLPAMDDDDERRGRPTVHKAYDEATAVLVGDALLTEAFSHLARSPGPPGQVMQLVRTLADAAGHRGMVGGQVGDIAQSPDVEGVHRRKTGALIAAAVAMGGIAGQAGEAQSTALRAYGERVGLAFQMADDVLDADEDAGDDGPPSYVRALGLDETRARAAQLSQDAFDAVANLDNPTILQAIARYTVHRTV
jgi:geranylgeranyl diphosphate synthase, type II